MSINYWLILTYFNQPFDIHTNTSHTQLGAVISQNGKPVAFYSRKLNPAQTHYTTTERALLSIVEKLKEFPNILWGQQINIYTDHKNLTYKHFNTKRVMQWCLIFEEFSPQLFYIKGSHNVVADALRHLGINDDISYEHLTNETLADLFRKDPEDLPDDIYPLEYCLFHEFQQRDNDLLQKLCHEHAGLDATTFRGGSKEWSLICHNNKIVVPVGV